MTPCTSNPPRTCLARDERGSVLMETVLAIPLYLVLIGGTFWIGELMLAKHKLVGADRFATWNAGNRHNSGTNGIKDKLEADLFPKDKVKEESITQIDYQN